MSDAYDRQTDAMRLALTAPGQIFEARRQQIRGVDLAVYTAAPQNLRDYFEACHLHPDKPFIVYGEERYSFAETYAKALHFGATMQSQFGIKKGDRVVLVMRNYPEWIFAFMGAVMIGAVIVPLNAWWQRDELDYAIKQSGAQLIVADAERAARCAQIPAQSVPIAVVRADPKQADAAGWHRVEDLLRFNDTMPAQLPTIDPQDDVSILYTSGSTGYPKGAVSTHHACVQALMGALHYATAAYALAEQAGLKTPDPVSLLALPLFHVTASHAVFLTSIAAARTLIFMHKWDAASALQLIERERVTYFLGVPTMSWELISHPDRETYDLSSLQDISAGGAPRPPEHVRKIVEVFKGCRPGIGYGMTETNALSVVNFGDGYIAKPNSTGRVIKPITEMKIAIDDQGSEAAIGVVGEIWWKSAALVRGYWQNPQATQESFTPDGWFKSGDLGMFDADGYLFIVDRKKDLIIRGGENISCVEVEAAIYSHPGVAEAGVFSLPDARLGEIVGAVVQLKAGEAFDGEALRQFLGGALANFKIPAQIWFASEQLPRLGSGKIDKVELKTRYRAQFAQQLAQQR
jgi:long-chain acyl-CoA synthetase